MEFDFGGITESGIDIKTGFDYTGGQDRYVSALQRYYRSSEGNKEKIKDYLEKNDMENLEIIFHSLKSNSKMIGALSLSDKFAALEAAAGRGDIDSINTGIDVAGKEYQTVLEALRPYGEMETFRAAGELTAEEAKETAEKLLEALDEFSDDLASDLISKLAGFPFRITQKEKLRKAAELINDFLYNDAAEVIREIIPFIE